MTDTTTVRATAPPLEGAEALSRLRLAAREGSGEACRSESGRFTHVNPFRLVRGRTSATGRGPIVTSAVDVAKYIKAQKRVLGEMQVQKLVYYAQAWALAWDGRPLFPERIEAWRMGPVLPVLRFRDDEPDINALSGRDRATVDAVLAFYGGYNGGQLGDMTHNEPPWQETRGDLSPSAPCDREISHDLLRRHYTQQSISGVGPVRSACADEVASSRDDLGQIAHANAERWREALDLLAR